MVTGEMVEELILSGADIIKVGIGPGMYKYSCSLLVILFCVFCLSVSIYVIPSTHTGLGSVCTTRKKTGVGYPQLSAVIECADAAHGLGGHIISVGSVVTMLIWSV